GGHPRRLTEPELLALPRIVVDLPRQDSDHADDREVDVRDLGLAPHPLEESVRVEHRQSNAQAEQNIASTVVSHSKAVPKRRSERDEEEDDERNHPRVA